MSGLPSTTVGLYTRNDARVASAFRLRGGKDADDPGSQTLDA
jgi:hypothetical protein